MVVGHICHFVAIVGYEDAGTAMSLVDEHGEHPYTRTDAYGPLHWRARRYDDGTYAVWTLDGSVIDGGTSSP